MGEGAIFTRVNELIGALIKCQCESALSKYEGTQTLN